MKTRVTIVLALIVGLSPALAYARTQTQNARQHGSSFHDRSPKLRAHDSQPRH